MHDETGTLSAALDAFGSTQGTVLYRGASAWGALGPGTSGQVLTSGGAGGNVSWSTLAAGNFSGPASSVADHIVTFADATGKLGKDSGVGIASLAPLASPTFTGTPAAPTQATADNTTKLATTAFVQAVVAAGDLQSFFQSAQQTITSAGLLTIAHGLGKIPTLINASLVCQTAEQGYSAGDQLYMGAIPLSLGLSATGFATAVVPDASNLNIRYGSSSAVFYTNNKTSGVSVSLTNANWRFVVRAWA
ncbi:MULTISPECIES: hypothetical protein [unclassified Mesorhizobium]|uniref:hypothetical protein n=1 Tax=unclassified Mesorhizobium TaxID=325217 RepID=UPI000FCAC802|nr:MULTISPECIES: hypothetical protein [unclassified Mesorhizobium]RUV12408.1 hypothetical protein EOA91_28070 [Mesorhizobium sp. M1A.F.Ca.IN.022.04.1.1]RWG26255.1 MAG: hypothetical protein EOQ60_27835 [Mesorhizobium sp.]